LYEVLNPPENPQRLQLLLDNRNELKLLTAADMRPSFDAQEDTADHFILSIIHILIQIPQALKKSVPTLN
jgi:hypothetical protein